MLFPRPMHGVAGLFVVMRGVEVAGLTSLVFEQTGPFLAANTLKAAAGFSAVVAVISNIVSNVPAVMLYVPLIQAQAVRDHLCLLLAMSSTLAGNLTIIGSVANLIVLEVTKDDVRISFMEYLKVGAPLTLLTVLVGVLFLR